MPINVFINFIYLMFYYVSVYTIHGTDIPYIFSYYMFRPDEAMGLCVSCLVAGAFNLLISYL
jgi:hypothetical protein